MNEQDLLQLLQHTYFDGIDQRDPDRAVGALTDDIEWIHTQVWVHDGHDRSRIDTLRGKDTVRNFLAARIEQMQAIGIEHKVRKVFCDGASGAFRAEVVGPEGTGKAFIGWVELDNGKVSKYVVYPEK